MGSSARMTSTNAPSDDYVPSREALAILDVKPQTLYSYVSRGRVRRISPDGRSSYYNREDIQRLRARSEARSGHGAVAESAMHWGEPVLITNLTEITVEGPRYRRHLAVDLAREGYPFEAVAEYLWSGTDLAKGVCWPADKSVVRIAPQLAGLVEKYPDLHFGQLLTETILLHAMDSNPENGEPSRASSILIAQQLVQALFAASGLLGPRREVIAPMPHESIAKMFVRAFSIEASESRLRAINAVLVLLADHEFTPATFAARIAASAGVDLHSCIAAALQVHFGSALGLRCDRVEHTLSRGHGSRQRAAQFEKETNRPRFGGLGFHHPLYRNGDPRTQDILRLALELKDRAPVVRTTLETLKRMDDSGEGYLSLDAGLVLFCRSLGIDKPVAGGLLALSRVAGWIAHVIEQRQQDFMIRPRGKFTGSAPLTDIRAG
jgi:citrate synthase